MRVWMSVLCVCEKKKRDGEWMNLAEGQVEKGQGCADWIFRADRGSPARGENAND